MAFVPAGGVPVPAGLASTTPPVPARSVVQVVENDAEGKEPAREPLGTEQVVGNGEVVIRKVHEADKVIVPKFPKVNNLVQWRIGVCRGLGNASGRSDGQEIPWLHEATDGSKTYEQLADCGDPRWKTLDGKLFTALRATIISDCVILTTKLQTVEEEAYNRHTFVTGRQLVFLIFAHFRLNADMKLLYDVEDITSLEWMGDHKIHSFYRLWFMMTRECEAVLPERTLRNMLARKLSKSTKLKEDIAYYDRLPEFNEQKTYAYAP